MVGLGGKHLSGASARALFVRAWYGCVPSHSHRSHTSASISSPIHRRLSPAFSRPSTQVVGGGGVPVSSSSLFSRVDRPILRRSAWDRAVPFVPPKIPRRFYGFAVFRPCVSCAPGWLGEGRGARWDGGGRTLITRANRPWNTTQPNGKTDDTRRGFQRKGTRILCVSCAKRGGEAPPTLEPSHVEDVSDLVSQSSARDVDSWGFDRRSGVFVGLATHSSSVYVSVSAFSPGSFLGLFSETSDGRRGRWGGGKNDPRPPSPLNFSETQIPRFDRFLSIRSKRKDGSDRKGRMAPVEKETKGKPREV